MCPLISNGCCVHFLHEIERCIYENCMLFLLSFLPSLVLLLILDSLYLSPHRHHFLLNIKISPLFLQVKDRLAMPDCIANGWLLDGFPRTPAQAMALSESGVSADCFIFLNVPDSILVERVVGRRTDPVTGKIYHMTFSPPTDEEVLARLEQRSDDTEEKVKVRLEQFHANVEAVKGSYVDIAVEVDGAQRPEDVSEVIMKSIDAVLA
jgi:adenylate kinase family enzyme